MGERLSEIWKRINIWQKMAAIIFFIMWIAISAGVVIFLDGNWVFAVVALCLLWLGYIAIAFVITRPHGQE